MNDLKLIQLGNDDRISVLKKLGYNLDNEGYVLQKKSKERLICKYSKEVIHINNAAILPGSLIVINANPVTMAEYFLDNHED
jgi:hypothetical protein